MVVIIFHFFFSLSLSFLFAGRGRYPARRTAGTTNYWLPLHPPLHRVIVIFLISCYIIDTVRARNIVRSIGYRIECLKISVVTSAKSVRPGCAAHANHRQTEDKCDFPSSSTVLLARIVSLLIIYVRVMNTHKRPNAVNS